MQAPETAHGAGALLGKRQTLNTYDNLQVQMLMLPFLKGKQSVLILTNLSPFMQALLTLRNIEAFAAYPNRMQKMIVAIGQYER